MNLAPSKVILPACMWEDRGMVPDERILASHWLYEWMDEEGIRRPGDYLKAIRKRTAIDRLHEISNRVYSEPTGRVSRSVGRWSQAASSICLAP